MFTIKMCSFVSFIDVHYLISHKPKGVYVSEIH